MKEYDDVQNMSFNLNFFPHGLTSLKEPVGLIGNLHGVTCSLPSDSTLLGTKLSFTNQD